MQVQLFERPYDAASRPFFLDARRFRRQLSAAVVALMTFTGMAEAEAPAGTVESSAKDVSSCEAFAANPKPSPACLALARELVDRAHLHDMAGNATAAQPYLEQAGLIAPEDLRVALEQALVDAASGHPLEARKRYDLLRGTAMERAAAGPSAVNLVVLGRFDEARKAFLALAGSADAHEAGYAQLWLLWLDARTWRGDSSALREKLARETVGMRAANAQQQALLNLYAGQGSVDAVFAAIEASVVDDAAHRRDARTEAALFAGGYLQYVMSDMAGAQRLYRRELPLAGASVERPLIQQSIGNF